MAEYSEEQKLQVLGKLKAGLEAREISEQLIIPYPIVLKWRKELKEAEQLGTVHTLVNADALLVSRVAEEVKEDLKNIAPTEGELITKDVNEVIAKVDSYALLNTQLHATALKAVSKISGMLDAQIGPSELDLLIDGLTKIQTAFFNKNSNTVNILNQNVVSDKEVSTFKSLQKKA